MTLLSPLEQIEAALAEIERDTSNEFLAAKVPSLVAALRVARHQIQYSAPRAVEERIFEAIAKALTGEGEK